VSKRSKMTNFSYPYVCILTLTNYTQNTAPKNGPIFHNMCVKWLGHACWLVDSRTHDHICGNCRTQKEEREKSFFLVFTLKIVLQAASDDWVIFVSIKWTIEADNKSWVSERERTEQILPCTIHWRLKWIGRYFFTVCWSRLDKLIKRGRCVYSNQK